MKLIGRDKIDAAVRAFPNGSAAFSRWVDEVKASEWGRPADIKEKFRSADFIGGDQVVFNVGGDKYRIIAQIDFRQALVRVLEAMNHEQYNAWNKANRKRKK